MNVPILTQDQMRAAVNELEQALYNHERWTESLYATLVCRLHPDERDVSAEAFRNCQFGQWYYASGHLHLNQYPGFKEIESEHRHMHNYAATLLRIAAQQDAISLPDYERFISALKRTRLEITTLKRDLEVSLYNLDPLTGVPSRNSMLSQLREQHELAKRNIHPCCVAMFDIDHFKRVNDAYGHAAGDLVLIAISHYLQMHIRPYDKLFRYGGEEFLLCLPDTELNAGRDICARLDAELASIGHKLAGGERIFITLSTGIALLDPAVSVEAAIARADVALFKAKAQGRNCVVAWNPSLREPGAGAR